jgi:hypothetical protein
VARDLEPDQQEFEHELNQAIQRGGFDVAF